MMRSFGKIFLLLACGLLSAWAAARPPLTAERLQQRLAAIATAVPAWSGNNPEVFWLWDQQDYQLLYRHPCRLLEPSVELLAAGQLPPRQQEMLPFLLQQLPLGSYLEWMETAEDGYAKKEVSLAFLQHVAFPSPEERPDLYLAAKQDKFAKFYQSLADALGSESQDPLHGDLVAAAHAAASGRTGEDVLRSLKSLNQAPSAVDVNARCAMAAGSATPSPVPAANTVPPLPLPPPPR